MSHAERWCLAIDVGGTKLAAGLVGMDGQVLVRHQVPTVVTDDPETIFDALAKLVDDARRHGAERGAVAAVCGVGCGGPMDGPDQVSPLNIPAWRSFALRARLARHTGLPTFVENDAKSLALAERWCGAAVGEDNFLAMVVSTGVGGGIVLDGRLLDGRAGNAGHIGHVVVVPDGRRCACGGRGCLEAEASGLSIAAATGRHPADADTVTRRRTGRLVGRAVADVANLLDLPLALIGGSVALGFGEEFFAAARRELAARSRLAFSAGTRITAVGLGPDAPLVGAAAVGWRGLGAAT